MRFGPELPQADWNKQPPSSRNMSAKVNTFRPFGEAFAAVPSSRAGSSSQTAYSEFERGPVPRAAAEVCAAVVMVSVVVTVVAFGVTVADGVKVQVAIAGNVPQDRVIALA